MKFSRAIATHVAINTTVCTLIHNLLSFLVAQMFYMLENNWLFWPMFVTLIFLIIAFLATMSYVAELMARAIFGSYFIVVAVDYYAGSNLKYIIITIIRRVTIPGFELAFVYPPFQGAGMSSLLYLAQK